MKRNEACAFLTKIAQDELISDDYSRMLFKARDIVICEDNRILDVLASPETKMLYRQEVESFLYNFSNSSLLSIEMRKQAQELLNDLTERVNSGKCEMMYLPTRCKDCPNFNGFEEK